MKTLVVFQAQKCEIMCPADMGAANISPQPVVLAGTTFKIVCITIQDGVPSMDSAIVSKILGCYCQTKQLQNKVIHSVAGYISALSEMMYELIF